MTIIKRLNDSSTPEDFINSIKDKDLLIYEDIQGSKVYVKWTGKNFIIKPKSLRNEVLNYVDLTMQKFYSYLFYFLHTMPTHVTELLNKKWWFCFEYFPEDSQPANIEYKKIPKNNLILTCIVKNNKYYYNVDEIIEYAKLFDTDYLPIIFSGKLSDKQLNIIQLFLSTSTKDLEYVFGNSSFSYFFYKLLNPQLKNSFLMNDNEFNTNLEKIVIKINNNSNYSFEILNPLYKKMSIKNNTEHVEIYSLVLITFLEFLQLYDIENLQLKSLLKDELYVELICKLFNKYIENVGKDIENWNIVIPPFFKQEKFKININLLTDEKTKQLLENNSKIEYIFKIILSSFKKKKKNPIGLFTQQTLILFNEYVEKIDIELDKILKINRDYNLQKSDVKNFKEFFNLEYNVDSTGDFYPDMDNEKEKETDIKKKKKKSEKIPTDIKNFHPKKEKL